jgi:Domain of unknown function (DUF4160)
MPAISRFFGIVIAMHYNDHAPAHFHAKYGEHKAKIEIATGIVRDGSLPRRVLALVEEWRLLHRGELEVVWQLILERKAYEKIEPLE